MPRVPSATVSLFALMRIYTGEASRREQKSHSKKKNEQDFNSSRSIHPSLPNPLFLYPCPSVSSTLSLSLMHKPLPHTDTLETRFNQSLLSRRPTTSAKKRRNGSLMSQCAVAICAQLSNVARCVCTLSECERERVLIVNVTWDNGRKTRRLPDFVSTFLGR